MENPSTRRNTYGDGPVYMCAKEIASLRRQRMMLPSPRLTQHLTIKETLLTAEESLFSRKVQPINPVIRFECFTSSSTRNRVFRFTSWDQSESTVRLLMANW